MEIRIIIVDDDINNASELQEVVQNYKSIFRSQVNYVITEIFSGIYAFENAKKYISSSQNKIDILLTDYNLKRGLGTDLFLLISKETKVYKILHSETDESLRKSKDSLIGNLFNDFCSSKKAETIHEALKRYENEILNPKLFGNKKFQKFYFINEHRLNEEADKQVVDDIKLFDILYAETEEKGEEKMTLFFRNNTTDAIERRGNISKPLVDLKDNKLTFRRANRSLIINLLWVAKIDTINKTIQFITLDNTICKINYSPTELFNKEVSPFLIDLDTIPSFLKD